MRQSYFPSTSLPGANAYVEHPDARPQPATRPTLPPTQRAPAPAQSPPQHLSAARRGRGQLMHTMNAARPVRDDELHFGPMPGMPAPQRQQSGLSDQSDLSASSFARTDSWGSQASYSTLASSAPSARQQHATALASQPAVQAQRAIDFFHSNAAAGVANTPLRPEFLGNTRHLGVSTEQALERRLAELSSLEKQAHRYLEAVDTNPELAAALHAQGWSADRIEAMETQLSAQCQQQKKAIYTLQAHSLVRVSEDPTCTWVAQQMMASPQSRERLLDHLKDTRPLELKIKRNQLAGMQAQLANPPQRGASQQQVERYNQLSLEAGVLQSEIMALEPQVDPRQVPQHEHSMVLSTEVSDRYLATRYEPLRLALHDLRNQTDRAVNLARKNTKPETHELEQFRRQVDEMIGNMFRAENQRTAALVERAYADNVVPTMAYVPETAGSLLNLVAEHKKSTLLPRESVEVIQARSQLESARREHDAAHRQFMQQQEVMQRTGMAINDQVMDTARRTYAQLQHAERVHGPVVAQADQERATARAFADESGKRQRFCEDTLYRMLDSKIDDAMQRGYASLSTTLPPTLVGEQIELIRHHYTGRLQQLQDAQQHNTLELRTLRRQELESGGLTPADAQKRHALDHTRRIQAGQLRDLNTKLEFLDAR